MDYLEDLPNGIPGIQFKDRLPITVDLLYT